MNKNFERVLPEGYTEAMHIDARRKSFGIIFNLIAVGVLVAVVGLAALPLILTDRWEEIFEIGYVDFLVLYAVGIISMIGYIVLHELVHGAAYKLLTGERLTFGMSWSCAFCGVPEIFVYKRAAMIAVAAPLVLFSLIFLPLMIWLYTASAAYYMLLAILMGLHLGGCSGDGYVILLLLFKFKDKRLLLRDTGPEQFFYLPAEGGCEDAA